MQWSYEVLSNVLVSTKMQVLVLLLWKKKDWCILYSLSLSLPYWVCCCCTLQVVPVGHQPSHRLPGVALHWRILQQELPRPAWHLLRPALGLGLGPPGGFKLERRLLLLLSRRRHYVSTWSEKERPETEELHLHHTSFFFFFNIRRLYLLVR